MELFKSGLKSVLGSGSQDHSHAPADTNRGDEGAETVEKLVERLHASTLLEDRKGSCRALRSLSKKYRVEVGAQGMDTLINVLTTDRIDPEIVGLALESLLNITSPDLVDNEDANVKTMGKEFTEIFTKKNENVATLLSLLDEYDFRIKLPAIRLITNLLTNKPKDIQETLLVSPMGVSKLMDLLSDSREVIRNEALLLLIAVTKNNASIQKIIAFENGFDRIIQIIENEGFSDGGPVVEDSLHLFLNLLKNNTSNQTFFREGSYIKKLLPFFTHSDENEVGWPTQKVANVFHMLQVVRTLVSPLNPHQVTLSCQKSMKMSGILQSLCSILMANGAPAETLTEAIITVAESIRGCQENQQYFSSIMAPSDPPRSALLILLMTLVNERQPLSLRCAVLYCVQSYLCKNLSAQADVVQTLLPSSTEASLTPGQLLCGGLFSKDSTSNWFAATALLHSLLDNVAEKQNLLKVQLATKADSPPVSLLQHLTDTVQQSPKPVVKIGFLQFLSVWLESSPPAVGQFLSHSSAVPYLISQICCSDTEGNESFVQGLSAFLLGLCLYFNPDTVPSFTNENISQLITNRIGIETLTTGLNHISKSEYYLRSLKHPQVSAKHTTDLVFDNSFCLLFKKYEPLILNRLSNPFQQDVPVQSTLGSGHGHGGPSSSGGQGYMFNSHQSPNEVINNYKEVIRRQDEALELCKKEIFSLQSTNAEYTARMQDMDSQVSLLKSQIALDQAQRSSLDANKVTLEQHMAVVTAKDNLIRDLEMKLNATNNQYHFQGFAPGSENHIHSTKQSSMVQEEVITKLEEENKELVEEVERMKKDQEELLELLTEQDNRISGFKKRLRELGAQVEEDEDEDDGADLGIGFDD